MLGRGMWRIALRASAAATIPKPILAPRRSTRGQGASREVSPPSRPSLSRGKERGWLAPLQLLLADGGDAYLAREVQGLRLGKAGQGWARVVQDEVLEVLVRGADVAQGRWAHGSRWASQPVAPAQHRRLGEEPPTGSHVDTDRSNLRCRLDALLEQSVPPPHANPICLLALCVLGDLATCGLRGATGAIGGIPAGRRGQPAHLACGGVGRGAAATT